MENLYDILKLLHILGFVFMSVPLFNLIVVNERAIMGGGFVYATDRYMENIIRRGAMRCYVFQTTVLATGILLLIDGPGISVLWQNGVVLLKTVLLLLLIGLLSYVHFSLQPAIENRMPESADTNIDPAAKAAELKPFRVRRKKLATLCLFIVLVTIILGMQVYRTFPLVLTGGLISLAALFAWRANKTLLRFGWV